MNENSLSTKYDYIINGEINCKYHFFFIYSNIPTIMIFIYHNLCIKQFLLGIYTEFRGKK